MAESHIMVVDSDVVSREIMARILRNVLDAEVSTWEQAGPALLALADYRYNLVITARNLSDMDGLEFCRRMRATEAHHFTPIVVFTEGADEQLLKEGFSAGVTNYFDKSQGYPAFGNFIKVFSQRHRGMVGNVLYIEDSRTAATMAMRLFERHGLKVSHVESAEEGLELLQRVREGEGERFDIVITDLHLKGEMSGKDLLRELRGRLQYSQQELPVLMITGNDDVRTQVDAFHAGANDFVTKPLVEEVVMARVRSLLTIKHQHDALERQMQSMHRVANTDSLTGVRNRHYLLEHGEQLMKAAGSSFWVMLVDIDHFKQVNDRLGHLTGDHVLVALGSLLLKAFPRGTVVRFGGEEFLVLLAGVSRKEVMRRGESLRVAVEVLQPEGVSTSVSMGIAGLEDHPGVKLNALLGIADKALYAAKENGRNQVCLTQRDGSIGSVTEYLASA